MSKLTDLSGTLFGRLTVLKRSTSEKKGVYYECKCSCGTVKIVRSDNLTKGVTYSCGCSKYDNSTDLKDSSNNFLTYVSEAGSKSHSRYINCLCVCGKTVKVRAHDYVTGHIKSCGCLRIAISTDRIKQLHEELERNVDGTFKSR
jgi:hypothetical protein